MKNNFKDKFDLVRLELKLKPVLLKANNDTLHMIIRLCQKILEKRNKNK